MYLALPDNALFVTLHSLISSEEHQPICTIFGYSQDSFRENTTCNKSNEEAFYDCSVSGQINTLEMNSLTVMLHLRDHFVRFYDKDQTRQQHSRPPPTT